MPHALEVYVNSELTLSAGEWDDEVERGQRVRTVHPPHISMYEQLLDYLSSKESSDMGLGVAPNDLQAQVQAMLAVSLVWGSYWAVLVDKTKFIAPTLAQQDEYGLITEDELHRIHLESATALAEWIEVMRLDRNRGLRLAAMANQYLPVQLKKVHRPRRKKEQLLYELSDPAWDERTSQLIEATPTAEAMARRAKFYHARVLANAIIVTCWQHGPLDDLRGRPTVDRSFSERRITPDAERYIVQSIAQQMYVGLTALQRLFNERIQQKRSWDRRVMPYFTLPYILPAEWMTLTEKNTIIKMPAPL